MAFWGAVVTANAEHAEEVPMTAMLTMTQAALTGAKNGERHELWVQISLPDEEEENGEPTKGEKYLLGTLTAGTVDQLSFDLIFHDTATFSVAGGSGKVHLTGYFQPLEDDNEDMDFDDEDDEILSDEEGDEDAGMGDDDEDEGEVEEVPVGKAAKGAAAGKPQNNQQNATAKAAGGKPQQPQQQKQQQQQPKPQEQQQGQQKNRPRGKRPADAQAGQEKKVKAAAEGGAASPAAAAAGTPATAAAGTPAKGAATPNKQFTCTTCNKPFSNATGLEAHKKAKHST